MLLEEDIQKILDQKENGYPINLAFDGSEVWIQFTEDSSKLYLSTSVYNGGNYIPTSVRRCVSHKAPAPHPSIRTFLTVDEHQFRINLNYLGQTDQLSRRSFKEILEEFGFIAEKWRSYLDEHDKNDLVYVRVK